MSRRNISTKSDLFYNLNLEKGKDGEVSVKTEDSFDENDNVNECKCTTFEVSHHLEKEVTWLMDNYYDYIKN